MSGHDSDQNYILNLPLTSDFVQSTEVPTLAELSERDEVWDKHRDNSDKVSNHYKGSEFDSYAKRIYFCSELLDFKLTPDAEQGLLKLKLSGARFCRVRHCCVCQWRRSLAWKAKAYKILPKVIEEYPKARWLFLTLTIRNVDITQLRATLSWMNEAFARLTKLKEWPADGWIKSTEITCSRNKQAGNAHPHFHVLLMVPPSYFGAGYISQKRWAELWQKSARLDYVPQCHVKVVAKHHNPMQLIPEILKYQIKESDLVVDRSWFLELTRQLHKTRAVAPGGVLRRYLKCLEKEPEDLIGRDDTEVGVDEGHLYFEWQRQKKKYRQAQPCDTPF